MSWCCGRNSPPPLPGKAKWPNWPVGRSGARGVSRPTFASFGTRRATIVAWRCPSTWWAPPPSKRLAVVTPQQRVRFPSTSATSGPPDVVDTSRLPTTNLDGYRRTSWNAAWDGASYMPYRGEGSLEDRGRPPSVNLLARHLRSSGLPPPLLVNVARSAVQTALRAGRPESAWAVATQAVEVERRRLLQPVINATGVLLHTNLGRAAIAWAAPPTYTNVELDLATGRRGDRSAHTARLLALCCRAEAALVVNNGAAAILLVMAALAADREVIVSRGELVEIGDGFRIPELLATSGAHLVEVGTTNRTRLSDYAGAITDRAALFLKVHRSNFRITGFTEATTVSELAALVQRQSSSQAEPVSPTAPYVVVDLGSGLLDAECPWLSGGPPLWLAGEPAVRQTLAAGASLVTFSGDKLLGGPQAGIIAGRAQLIERCRHHPLARALRPGGLILGALQDTALAYLRRDAGRSLPLWRMATYPVEVLHARASEIGQGAIVECASVMGGGTLPGRSIPSVGVAIPGDVTASLREASPPVLARVGEGHTICDLRTIFPDQDGLVARALAAIDRPSGVPWRK